MPTYTKDDRRRGLEYANRLAEFAKDAPDELSKSRTRRAVSEIRKVFGFKDEDKMRDIRFCLRQGCSSYDDLVGETKLPKPELVRLIALMSDVRVTQMLGSTGGRPAMFLSLIVAEGDFVTPKS